jgi:dipeptidyl aminopeptidase/acylaminoacyl peptidase
MGFRLLAVVFLSSVLATAAGAQQPPVTEPATRSVNDGNVVLSGIPEVPREVSERLQPYQNTRTAVFAAWAAEGDEVYIRTRFGNVMQIHRVARPGGARQQLTFLNEPVAQVSRRPAHRELLYAADVGGGEFYQFYLFDPGSGAHRRITDGRSRNSSPSWDRSGGRLAWVSTRRDGRSNDIWVMSPDDTASARMVLGSPDGTLWVPVDWDPAGERLLVANYISITDTRVHLLDLRTGEHRRLAGGPENQGAFRPLAFDRDGGGVFLATDEGSEFTRLAYMPLDGGPMQILTQEIPWDVDGGALSDDRTRAAFVINEGGSSRLHLLDPASRRYAPVAAVPMGLIGGLEFSPDGRRLAFTLNTATAPGDVYTLDLGADRLTHGELVRWTYSEVGGLNPDRFVAPELIEYRSFDGRMIPAFVYRPQGDGPHPVVISIHGGPEGQSRPGFSSVFQSWLGEHGIAVIDPNVRGSSGYGRTYVGLDDGVRREDAVRDIGALLDWIASRPELDQNRVMVYGGSYGGYMVLASLMHYSDRLRGGVDIVGISDFITFLENTESYRRDLRRAEYGDERAPEMRAVFERISPLRNAERITAPLFVIQGQNDPRVPVSEAEQIVERVRANGHAVWYMNALNEGHGYARRENQDLMRDLVVLFFREHLLPR